MKIKIIEYKIYKGNKCKVWQYHNHKGKWVKNPRFAFHYSIANQLGKYERGTFPILFKKEYEIER